MLPAVNAYGLGFLPFFPLFQGVFTEKYTRSSGSADGRLTVLRPELLERVNWDAMERYQAFRDDRGITMLEATFGWFLGQPGVTSIIAGATKPEQVGQNVAAGSVWTPTSDDLATVSEFFPR